MTEQSAGALFDQILVEQLSEIEATDLFADAQAEYREARDGLLEISLVTPLLTPRAWWLLD